MSAEFYKVLHLLAILVLFTAMGGLAMVGLRGGSDEEKKRFKQPLMILHGVALVVTFVAGFGLIAKMGLGWPMWILGKLGVWLVLGGLAGLAAKRPALGNGWFIVLPALGAVGAALAVYKPM